MWIVDNNKLFFMRVPKTGSHTIYQTFRDGRGFKGMHGKMGDIYRSDKNLYDKIVNSYKKYCIIRNPWDHAVSRYFHDIDVKRFGKRQLKKYNLYTSFDDYVLNNLYEPQQNTTFCDDKIVIDEWIRFENLSQELEKICIDNQIKFVKYHSNKNIDRENYFKYEYPKDYRIMYKKDETIEMVSRLSENEIKTFNYKF